MGASESKGEGWLEDINWGCCDEGRSKSMKSDSPNPMNFGNLVSIISQDNTPAQTAKASEAKILPYLRMDKTLTPKEEIALGLKLSVLHYEDREKLACRSHLSADQKKRVCKAVEEFYRHWNRLPESSREDLCTAEKLNRDDELNIAFMEREESLEKFLNAVKKSRVMKISPTNRSAEIGSSSPPRKTRNLSRPSSPQLRRSQSPSLRSQSPTRRSEAPTGRSQSPAAASGRGGSQSPTSGSRDDKLVPPEPRMSSKLQRHTLASKGKTGSGTRGGGVPFSAVQADANA